MNLILYILIFMIGTVFGSFFTLAIYRLPLGKDIIHKRSFCPNCNHKLRFLDMIPILSYIFLGGKCRYCKNKIKPRYLILEVLSGITFLLFAISLDLNIYDLSASKLIYVCLGLLYIAGLFIIAGIDKQNRTIQVSVLLYESIISILYMIYLYVVEEANMYRYVIYLCLFCLLELYNIRYIRKNGKNNYIFQTALLCLCMSLFCGEGPFIISAILTILVFLAIVLVKKLKKHTYNLKQIMNGTSVVYILCICNIISLILTNYLIYK